MQIKDGSVKDLMKYADLNSNFCMERAALQRLSVQKQAVPEALYVYYQSVLVTYSIIYWGHVYKLQHFKTTTTNSESLSITNVAHVML